MTLVVSVMSAVGVNVPVQVMPPSAVLSVESVPFCTVTSALAKAVTASLNTMVTDEVSPTLSVVSDIVIEVTVGAVVSITDTAVSIV